MDDQLRSLARAARAEVEAALDVEAEMAATLQRTPTDLKPRVEIEQPRRRAVAWVAAVAAVAIAGGFVVARTGDDDTLQTTSFETDTTIDLPTTQPSVIPTSENPSSTTAPSTTTSTVVGDAAGATFAVDVANPPPDLDLVAFATIPYEEEARPDLAVGELGMVINLPNSGAIGAIGFSGEQRTIELSDELADSGLFSLTYGPGDVVYGLRSDGSPVGIEMVAVPLSGDRAGEVVARSESLSSATWVELPVSAFGHGPDGIVARVRDVGATLMGYVDIDGAPTTLSQIPHFATIDDQLVVTADNFAAAWPLEINGNRTPQASYTGPAAPAPATDLRTVYATNLRPTDDESSSDGADQMPAVAVLEANGTGAWGSVPDGFEFLASDSTGTAFGRVVDGATLELSLLSGSSVNWRSLNGDGSGIAEPCLGCTQLLVGDDGVPVTYDEATRQLVRHSLPPVEATLPDGYGESPFLYHLGPDDVVYLQVAPAIDAELAADIVAVRLSPDDAQNDRGKELGRWANIVNNVGDSELVETPEGLVNVNCCGPDIVRPEPDSPVLVPWLDRNGDEITTSSAFIQVEVSYPTLTVQRSSQVPATTQTWMYEPGGDWQPRGMPTILPTIDGGFIAATFGSGATIARGWPDGNVETIQLDDTLDFPDALDPSGRFLVANNGFYIRVNPFADRVDPFADRTEYWEGDVNVGASGAITLLGLDAAVNAGPNWAADPIAFGNAVAGRPTVNEIRAVAAEQQSESEWIVTVTTSNLFDDSVAAVRWELSLSRGDDGRFRFVSGVRTTACAPDRGHQDFSTELCI